MPLHQHVGSGETMHRDGVGFEYAHDLAKDQYMVADVLHHLITEAELEMTVGKGDAIIRFVHALQSLDHARLRDVALVPIIVAPPPIDDVNPVNVIAHAQ